MFTHQPKTPVSKLAFFDSGQGGLTIWNHIRQKFPGLHTIYLGDNARYPFGTKSAATVKRYTTEAILALTELGADAIVVACGTASSVAVPGLTQLFKVPIIGVVEGMSHQAVSCLKQLQRHCTVAVLGTPYTIKSQRFVQATLAQPGMKELLDNMELKIDFWSQACPLFVPLVEEGFQTGGIIKHAVEHYLQHIPQNTRVILLGCTHFPRLIEPIIVYLEQHLGRTVRVFDPASTHFTGNNSTGFSSEFDPEFVYLIDPALAVEQNLSTNFSLKEDNLLLYEKHPRGDESFSGSQRKESTEVLAEVFCTDDPDGFERTARVFCTANLPKVQKKVISL